MDKEHNNKIDQMYHKLNKRLRVVYDFVIYYHNYIYTNHSYETTFKFNMMEIHTLIYIDDNPGITVTELSKIWFKTKSAVSQVVKRLVEDDLVERVKKETNNKYICLYLTEKGKAIALSHKEYDVTEITRTMGHLTDKCGKADVDAFYRVLDVYTDLVKENFK